MTKKMNAKLIEDAISQIREVLGKCHRFKCDICRLPINEGVMVDEATGKVFLKWRAGKDIYVNIHAIEES